MQFVIKAAQDPGDLAQVATLISEYAISLGIDLSFQNLTAELADLRGTYTPPAGALFLAQDVNGQALGCIGVRPLMLGVCCEMKRLYVRPGGRGIGTGRALAESAISFAENRRYQKIVLDTLPAMSGALALYWSLGFQAVPPYYVNPVPGALFFAKALRP